MINMTHPENSRLLSRNLARNAGGSANNTTARFKSKADADYQALLAALQEGAEELAARPRMDMEGGVAVPQNRDFGRVW
jgi:hypothetical protein